MDVTSGTTVKPSQLQLLQRLLHGASLRQKVLSHNVANVNTPGYHRKSVSFEQQLSALTADPEKHQNLEPMIFETEGLPERADGNNVDIDREIGELNKNALLYQTYAQILASKMSMMRTAITGR